MSFFLGEWLLQNAINLKRILRCFYLVSGLRINHQKSSVFGIRIDEQNTQCMADLLGCGLGSFPFKYLGLQVGTNMNLIRNWQPIIDIFRRRLSAWKAKTLSYGGRISLLKSMLNSLPTYYFSLFKAPTGVIKSLERIRREFFWGDLDGNLRMKWVAWRKFTSPRDKGGMGFGSLRIINLSLLAKWWWRFKTSTRSLWKEIILAIHGSTRTSSFIPIKRSISSPWKQIAHLDSEFSNFGFSLQSLFHATPGLDSKVRFWLDPWLMESPLSVIFPHIAEIDRVKHAFVKDRISLSNHGYATLFSWRRSPFSRVELDELIALTSNLAMFEFGAAEDKWRWKIEKSGVFTVKSLKNKVDSFYFQEQRPSFEWNNWAPIKVNFLAWRILNNGIPTATALSRRGINISDTLCPLCRNSEELTIHLFGTCIISSVVWDFVARWCRLPPIFFLEPADLVTVHHSFRGRKQYVKAIHLVFLTVLWAIWRHRNAVKFEGKQPSPDCIIGEVKSLGYLWIRNRAKIPAIIWSN